MAESPAHRFGQIIGDVLEAAVGPLLAQIAHKHGLYLDSKGKRPARAGAKVSWVDLYGNSHDLDFVLERGGTDTKIGTPVAFIETAWRRYTKHSRNKAQEIQGAILPLVGTHQNAAPFMGAILAGVFTHGALTQLRSLNFKVLYFSYESVVTAFSQVGIDAAFDEATADTSFALKVQQWNKLSDEQRSKVAHSLTEINHDDVAQFVRSLEASLIRQIEFIHVLPLHGKAHDLPSVKDAISFIEAYNEQGSLQPIVKYEIQIRFNNKDSIEGRFADKDTAIEFLRSYQPPDIRPAQPVQMKQRKADF